MRRKKRRAKPGFALLEAMVFVILMLLLSAAMLAAAYNMHRRSVERVENDRAYNAAVAALKIAGNEIANGADPDAFKAETSYTLDVTPEGEARQTYAAITMRGEVGAVTVDGESFEGVQLTATATVADETETVRLTLQKVKAEVYPHTLFGAGFAGAFSSAAIPTLTLGPDTDLYLYGRSDPLELTGLTAGGNVTVQGAELTLRDSSVAGSVVSDSALTLANTLVGGDGASAGRLANVYSSAQVSLEAGARVDGDVYAPLVSSRGRVELLNGHSIYCNDKALDAFTVFDENGGGHLTTETAPAPLSRTGTLTFSGAGRWITPAGDPLKSPFPASGALSMFVPNFPVNMETHPVSGSPAGITAKPSATESDPNGTRGVLYRVADGAMLTLTGAQPAPGADGKPAVFVVLGEDSTLMLEGPGPFYLCVYGQGPFLADGRDNSTVKVDGGAVIYGSLQGVQLDVIDSEGLPNTLTVNYVQPYLTEYQAPGSAGYNQDTWRVVGYDRLA